jgi:hypothetical protein
VRERRETIAEACAAAGREPIPFSVMTSIEGMSSELARSLRALADAGAERAMLQHLAHHDLDTVRRVGREVIPEVT